MPALATAAASQTIGLLGALAIVVLVREPMPGTAALAWGAVAGLAGLAGIVALYRVLADGTMSIASPVAGVIGAGLPVLAGFAFGDRVATTGLAGIACGLVAIAAVSGLGGGRPMGAEVRRMLPLILAAGVGFAGFFLGIDQAVRAGGMTWWPLVAARATTVAVSLVLVARSAAPGALGGSWRLLVLVGLGDLMGNAFFLLAHAQGALSTAVVLSSLYPVATVMLARLVLRERLQRGQAIGVGLALVGVVLIALPAGA